MENNTIYEVTGRFVTRRNNRYNSDFCVNVIHVKESDGIPKTVLDRCQKGKGWDITVIGFNLPTTKARYFGDWVETKYGMQFKAVSYEYVTPDTKKGLISFLSSKKFKGIGVSMATSIVDIYGMKSLEVIKETPEKLLTIRGLSVKKINILSETLKATEYYNQLALFLGTYGVESTKIIKIANAMGKNAVANIKANPYCMTTVEGIGFKTADDIAKAMSIGKEKAEVCDLLGSYSRIKSACISKLKEHSNLTGDTFTEYRVIYTVLYNDLNSGFPFEIVSKQNLSAAFKRMFHDSVIYGFEVNGKKCVFDFESNRAEKEVADRIHQLLSSPIEREKQEGYKQSFLKIEQQASRSFSEDQRVAISQILQTRVAILNGGPGTGKSTCLKAITDCYKAVNGENCSIIQVAPTGKAARRMTEATGILSDTIHRACGIYTSSDLCNGGTNKFPSGLVICDEVSMVDSEVMRCLLNSVDLKSQIILVGDTDQLTSVGAGAVLRDMIASGIVPTYKLTVNHRQADGSGIIVENARKINAGQTNLRYSEQFTFLPANDDEAAWTKILQVYESECSKWGEENVVILCPRRHNTRISVDNINRDLQNIVNPKYSGDLAIKVGGQEFRVHDRVIQTKNTEHASNGDIGVIKRIAVDRTDSDEGELIVTIEFEDNNVLEYDLEDMQNVDLAYSITIHKSQGSEYASVIIPLLKSQKCPLFQRALLFTGITRARQKCTIIGDVESMNYCISNNQSLQRQTLLKERLQK